ncbi:MAG: hypothetical protein ISS16_12380 [Ignavibacteria bacterium]|nr:hypothetical protein [Ignavibacteria bacterium]
MEYKIEKMNKMRRNILIGVLIGTVIAFGLLMLPTFFSKYRFQLFVFKRALLLWLLTLIIFGVRYLIYRKKLMKAPSLRTAVNDERVKLNWLRAYRFALLIVVGITIFWKWYETSFFPEILRWKMMLPHGPWLIVFGAVISLIGSFLYYNREVKNG